MKMKYETNTVRGKIQVMEHFADTHEQPYIKHKSNNVYSPLQTQPVWDWNGADYNYPAEPEPPKLVPWTFETCPKGVVLIRQKGGTLIDVVACWSPKQVYKLSDGWWGYGWLADQCEHSLDNGRTWLPCGTEERR